jgi:hypothetical protein
MTMSPAGLRTNNDCAGKGQQQFARPEVSQRLQSVSSCCKQLRLVAGMGMEAESLLLKAAT